MNTFLKRLCILTIFFSMFLVFPITISFSATSDEGYSDGYSEGWLEGIEKAERDMAKGNSKNYSRSIPSDNRIIETYDLKTKSTKYKNAFLDGFKDGFKNGYNETYKSSDDDEDDSNEDNEEIGHAEILGLAMGETYGYRDHYAGKTNKWSRAIPSNSEIVEVFDLKKETNNYRTTFISAFKAKFEEGYEEGYRKAKFEPFENSIDQGQRDGEYFGRLLGNMYGKRDYFFDRDSNWERNLLSRAKIINDFSLFDDSEEYKDSFVEAFIYAFEEKYNDSYREANSNVSKLTYENGYSQGKEIGLKRGQGFANTDVLLGMPSSLLRYLSNEFEVTNEFELYLENDKYKEGFISGYNEGLNEGYIKTYQDLNYTSSLTKLKTQVIPISGGEIATDDNRISLKINSGTYYNDVAVSIDGLPDVHNLYLPSKNRFIKASELYTIRVANSSYQINNGKLIELSFEYYGPQNGGIYKYNNNSWTYIPSKISENRITTYIRPSSLNATNGMYAVFIDESFKNIKDIRGHWAKDEINAYARRGLAGLFSDNTYRPDSSITRGQMLALLSRVYNWNLNDLDKNIKELAKLEDYESMGAYKSLISYGLRHGYMSLYPDNTFKVNNKVTYKQVEYIMKKVTGDINFTWNNVAINMMQHKDTRCKSYNSMDNTITRAEAIFMLYLLNE
ncbi:S-layer homology domain-containing protein [Proteiniborus sp.]|uniref:S-layer homology domain-containing protein n=1 Tax=Proteiniborus sp. TaxID=2079015 RepID=UPI0033203B72